MKLFLSDKCPIAHRIGILRSPFPFRHTSSADRMNQLAATDNRLSDIFSFRGALEIMDVGAAAIAETPIYVDLLNRGLGKLNAFEGDARHVEGLKQTYRDKVQIFNDFLFDGTPQTVYEASPASGMTSLLKPNAQALKFFNGFDKFGEIFSTADVHTKRLDDLEELPQIDMLKMDIQGAELTVLKNGRHKLADCAAIQLEVSFICLYENQPSFGEVDLWMREMGYAPHCFLNIKRWSISPTIRDNNFRIPFNQLLESDIVYIKDPLNFAALEPDVVKKLGLISHYCLKSPDLTIHCLRHLVETGSIPGDAITKYLAVKLS